MPPKMPGASAHLTATLDAAITQTSSTSSCLRPATARCFSTTPSLGAIPKNRYAMHEWLKKRASRQIGPDSPPGGYAYLGQQNNQPFPNNPFFRSEAVLSEKLRNRIWEKVVKDGEAIKAVSEEFGVDVRRVAAVVRLKQVEQQMVENGEPMAKAYGKAVNSMLPKTYLAEGNDKQVPHEPINEIPMHPYTMGQLFVPVSESRQFTREDAAKAFHDNLLSADDRSYQKELIAAEREMTEENAPRKQTMEKFRKNVREVEEQHAAKVAERMAAEEARTTTYETGRAAYRIKDVKVEDAGRDGKSAKGVGWRYGAPHQDRKRGLVKIPTQIP